MNLFTRSVAVKIVVSARIENGRLKERNIAGIRKIKLKRAYDTILNGEFSEKRTAIGKAID